MKKVTDFLKPNILIILGALLFLFYMNWLNNNGAALALGIVAVICAVYYVTIGVLSIVIGDKFSPILKKVFEVISVDLFASFMFAEFLVLTIQFAQIDGFMGPTAWIIAILSMIASLTLVVVYSIAKFTKQKFLVKFAYLFSAIFALVLLLDILFDSRGDSIVLGNINIILVVIYIVYVFYLFNSFEKSEPEQVTQKEEAQPEPQKEEE